MISSVKFRRWTCEKTQTGFNLCSKLAWLHSDAHAYHFGILEEGEGEGEGGEGGGGGLPGKCEWFWAARCVSVVLSSQLKAFLAITFFEFFTHLSAAQTTFKRFLQFIELSTLNLQSFACCMLFAFLACFAGLLSKNYRLIASNLAHLGEVKKALEAASISWDCPTFVLSECVFTYLPAKRWRIVLTSNRNIFLLLSMSFPFGLSLPIAYFLFCSLFCLQLCGSHWVVC